MASFESYVFDFGNTFVDLRAGYESTFSSVFGKFKMPYDPKKVFEYADTPLDELFAKYHTGCTCQFRDFMTMMMATYERNMYTSARLYGDTPMMLKALQSCNRRLGIVSRSYEEHIHRILSQFRLEDAFISIVGLDRTALQRPHPYSVDLCLREMGADKHSTLLVSSNPHDIEMGANAGVKTALLDRNGTMAGTCAPDYYVHNLIELLNI